MQICLLVQMPITITACPLKCRSSRHTNTDDHHQKPYFSITGNRRPILFSESCFSRINSNCTRLAASCHDSNDGFDDEIKLPGDLRPELMPKHVAVILDGHGRWAKNKGLPLQDGHHAGVENLKRLILQCSKYRIKVLTVYAFSTENWNRSKEEIDFLMRLFDGFIKSFITELIIEQNLQFSVIGEKSRLPEFLQSTICSAEERAKNNTGTHLAVALGYGGRCDIIEATKKIASKIENGSLRAKDVTESVFELELWTNVIEEYPNPDLLIRTSGEQRISNFLLWQLAYTEFYFANILFPDFGELEFVDALTAFQQRQRRFGKR